eukprot:6725153-Alexandrium_andersonii.AAC.1
MPPSLELPAPARSAEPPVSARRPPDSARMPPVPARDSGLRRNTLGRGGTAEPPDSARNASGVSA